MTDDALRWQVGIWDRLSQTYATETDQLFEPVVHRIVDRAGLRPGETVLDLGSGTGSVAIEAAGRVGPNGSVVGIDPSPRMLEQAKRRGGTTTDFVLGTAEEIPSETGRFDVAIASLSLMYVIDRTAAAAELARVLRPGGRLVAVVWSDADHCDIVRVQDAVGAFGPSAPVAGVGPSALADPRRFLEQLGAAGIDAGVDDETFTFEVADFALAWEVMAEVTASRMSPERREEARAHVRKLMWPNGDGPRTFTNRALFISGRKR